MAHILSASCLVAACYLAARAKPSLVVIAAPVLSAAAVLIQRAFSPTAPFSWANISDLTGLFWATAGAVAGAFAVADDRPLARRLGIVGLFLLSLALLLAHNHSTALIGLFGIVVMAILLLGHSPSLQETDPDFFHEPALSALAAGAVAFLLFCVTPEHQASNADRHRPSSGDARAASSTRLPAAPRASPTDLGLLALGIAITAFAAMRPSPTTLTDERQDTPDSLPSGAPRCSIPSPEETAEFQGSTATRVEPP